MNESETYSEEETERRREAALKRLLKTPHKPHKPLDHKSKGGPTKSNEPRSKKT